MIQNVVSAQNTALPGLEVWNVTTGKRQFAFAAIPGVHMLKASWSPDGTTIATLGNNGQLYLWNAANGSHIITHRYAGDDFIDLFWSPNGLKLALGTDNGNLLVWDRLNNHGLYYYIHAGPTRAWLWLQDGHIALIDETKTVQYFNTVDFSLRPE